MSVLFAHLNEDISWQGCGTREEPDTVKNDRFSSYSSLIFISMMPTELSNVNIQSYSVDCTNEKRLNKNYVAFFIHISYGISWLFNFSDCIIHILSNFVY